MDYNIHWSKAICREPHNYIGWPTIARKADGELLAVFSGGREEHVCPYGQTEMVRSRDNGESWSAPEVINNTSLDDRDAGIIVLKSGTIVISWFIVLQTVASVQEWRGTYPDATIDAWERHIRKVSDADRQRWMGVWTRRSVDGGATWEPVVNSIVSAPHGPIQLRDGRLLYVGVQFPSRDDDDQRLLCVESTDEGYSWSELGPIPITADRQVSDYHEPHCVERGDGRLVSLWRYQPVGRDDEWYLHQSESTDGGVTWSVPRPTPMWGFPPHLIRLHDNSLLATYGYRRPPYGERACLSHDGGQTWDIANEIILRDDGINGDLGYPASVELSPGELLTVYYQVDRHVGLHKEKPSLCATRWSLK